MRREARLHKIRIVQRGKTDVYGVTIPPSLSHWIGVHVSIREEGTCLVLESGCIPLAFSKKDILKNSENGEKIKI